MKSLPTPLSGIVPPILTPLNSANELDTAGLKTLIDRMINGGVHGIFALGTTGEAPHLPHQLQHQVVELVCEHTAGRVPVLFGITDSCFESSIDLADQAYAAGAAGLVAAPPYYLPMGQAELLSYTGRLASRCPLPLMLYNMPSCTKVEFTPTTVRQLAEHNNIVGLKDSSGDLKYFAEVADLCRDIPTFSLLVGPEEVLVDAMKLGCHGGVHGGANLFPQLYVELHEAITNGDENASKRLQQQVSLIGTTLYAVGDQPSRIVKGLKTAAHLMGLCQDYVAEPFQRFGSEDRATIAGHLQKILPAILPEEKGWVEKL